MTPATPAPADARQAPPRWTALAVASALLAAPLLAHPYLPLLDLPQHVGAVAILAGGPEAFGFADLYELDLLGSPYLLPYLLAAALAQLLGAKLAVHALFALAAAAWPWASWRALRGLGRDPDAALLLAPLAYGTFVFLGFLNFALSLPLFLFWLGTYVESMPPERWSKRRGLGMAILGVALYYGHVMTFAFACGAAIVIALAGGRDGIATRMRRTLHLLPGAALLAAWALASGTASQGELGRMVGGAMAEAAPQWQPPLQRLHALVDHLTACYHDVSDDWLLLALLAALVASALARRLEAPDATTTTADAMARVPALLCAAALALGLLLPADYRGIWPIAARMAPLVAALALLLPRGRLLWPRATVAVGLALTLATAWTHERHFQRFDAEVGPLDEALAALPPGPRVMTLVFDAGSSVVAWPAFLHFSQYALAEKGGVAEFSFVNFTKSPIHYREASAPPRLPARFEWTPERYDHAGHGPYYSHLLARGSTAKVQALTATGPKVTLLRQAGAWSVWAIAPGTPATTARSPAP